MRPAKTTSHSLVSRLMDFICGKMITHNVLVAVLEHVLHSVGAYTSFYSYFLPGGTI